jgi:hypothetical protein
MKGPIMRALHCRGSLGTGSDKKSGTSLIIVCRIVACLIVVSGVPVSGSAVLWWH